MAEQGVVFQLNGIRYRLKRLHGNTGTFQRLNDDGTNWSEFRPNHIIQTDDGVRIISMDKMSRV